MTNEQLVAQLAMHHYVMLHDMEWPEDEDIRSLAIDWACAFLRDSALAWRAFQAPTATGPHDPA